MLSIRKINTMSKSEFQAATAPDKEVDQIMRTWKGTRYQAPKWPEAA